MARYKVKVKMLVTKEMEVTADSHDDVKKMVEGEAIKDGYTSPKIDYINTEVIPEKEDPADPDYDLELLDIEYP